MPAPGSRLPSRLEISPAENMPWATVALEFRLLGEGLVEMGRIGIARDGGVELDVLLGDGALEAGALADRDLVEGAVLDEFGLVHDVSADVARFVGPMQKDKYSEDRAAGAPTDGVAWAPYAVGW